MDRRNFIKTVAGLSLLSALPVRIAHAGATDNKRVVVIGGGFGGSSVAKYLKRWAPNLSVTVIDKASKFASCPLSNLILNDVKNLGQLTFDKSKSYEKNGIEFVTEEVLHVDTDKKTVVTMNGYKLEYDYLVVSPGIDFMPESVEGLSPLLESGQILHAYRVEAGNPNLLQTKTLRDQLNAVPKGGVVAITIPKKPYRCPPAPYERACQMAFFMKKNNPKGKIIVLDNNPEIVIEKQLFTSQFEEIYKNSLTYVPSANITGISSNGKTLKFSGGSLTADLINLIPNQKASKIAKTIGLVNVDDRWCGVNPMTFESTAVPNVYVIGDAAAIAPLPKSGHVANQEAKVCAAAIIDSMNGSAINNDPVLTHTCFSFVDDKTAGHISAVYRLDKDKKAYMVAPRTGGSATESTKKFFQEGLAWGDNIMNDVLG